MSNAPPRFEPTPQEIAEACKRIRAVRTAAMQERTGQPVEDLKAVVVSLAEITTR